jgi:hypothetical protein
MSMPESALSHILEMLKWRVGIPRDFWYTHVERIGQFVVENHLTPMSQLKFAGGSKKMADAEEKAQPRIQSAAVLRDWRGGIRTPHLHLHGELYVLNQAQWLKFTDQIRQDVSDKLKRANESGRVGFEQFVDLTEALDQM